MSGWTRHTGPALLLDQENIDTDQLIPARFMSTPRDQGYGDYLLYDQRFDADGAATDHPLNTARPSVLIAGRNFGSGSSREAAVYALVDFGIRVVLAPSFGDIFASNAVNNGLLPARMETSALHGADEITVDLETCTARAGHAHIPFDLDPVWRTKLINGWDDIDLTRQYLPDIQTFSSERKTTAPWSLPNVTY